jgi:hypothetical protein
MSCNLLRQGSLVLYSSGKKRVDRPLGENVGISAEKAHAGDHQRPGYPEHDLKAETSAANIGVLPRSSMVFG